MADAGTLAVDVIARIDKLESEMKRGASVFQQQTNRMERAASAFSGRIKTVFATVGTFFAARSVISGFTSIINTIADFEQNMSAVKAVTKASDDQMKRLITTARSLAKDTKFSASQAAEGMKYLGMAGLDAEKIIGTLPAMLSLAAAGAMDLGTAADIATNIMTAFSMNIKDAGHMADVLAYAAGNSNTDVMRIGESMKFAAAVANEYKISIEETAAAIMVLASSGISSEMAGTGLRKIITSLADESNRAKMNIKDMSFETNSLAEILAKIAKIDPQIITDVFGERGGPAALILRRQADLMREFSDKLKIADGAAKNMASTMSDNLYGAFERIRSKFTEVILVMGEEGLSGSVRRIAERFDNFMNDFIENGRAERMGNVIGFIFEKTIPIIESFLTTLDKIIIGMGVFEHILKRTYASTFASEDWLNSYLMENMTNAMKTMNQVKNTIGSNANPLNVQAVTPLPENMQQQKASRTTDYLTKIMEASKKFYEEQKKLQEQYIQGLKNETDAMKRAMMSRRDWYQEDKRLLEEARKLNAITQDEYTKLLEHVENTFNGMVDASQRSAQLMEQSFSDFFFDAMQGDFSNFFENIKSQFDRIMSDLLARNVFNMLEPLAMGAGNPFGFLFGGIRHSGGPTTPGYAYRIEQGEYFVPNVAGRVEPKGNIGETTIMMNISTPDANSFRKSQQQILTEMSIAADAGRRNR